MKSYSIVKNISKGLIYFSVFSVLIMVGTFVLSKNQIMADEAETEQTSSASLSVTAPEKAIINEPFEVKIESSGMHVHHFSIFATKADEDGGSFPNYGYQDIDAEKICHAGNHEDASNCKLCWKKSIQCDIHNTNCSKTFNLTLEQARWHRIVVIAIKNDQSCVAEGEESNTLRFNKEPVVLMHSTPEEAGTVATATYTDSTGAVATTTTPTPTTGTQAEAVNLTNPTTINSIYDVLDKIQTYFLIVAGILAFAAIIVGGFQIMTSAGNPDMQAKGKKTILYSIVGVFIGTISWFIVYILIDILNKITSLQGPS